MLCRKIIAVCSECTNAKLDGIYGNHWALGLIVRDDVVLSLIAECSCLAHNCVQARYRRLVTALPWERIITVCRLEESFFRQAG